MSLPPGGDPLISIIIPVWRERGLLPEQVWERLGGEGREIIIVRAAGDEETPLPRAGADFVRIVSSEAPGRGRQMNRGAATARGEALLFLHADTMISPDSFPELRATLADPAVAVGAYTFASDGEGLRYRLMEGLVALRCRFFNAPYGDQALFIRRSLFEEIGGYDETLPLFEDLRLVEAALRRGRLGMIDHVAVTSSRRYEERGFFRTTLRHLLLFAGYRMRFDPARLAAMIRR